MTEVRKQKLLTLLQILYEQTDENHPLNAPQLIELLAEKGIVCERKAIYRDIESLIDFGFDILSSTAPQGYFWGQRLFELPELRMMIDSIRSSEFITKKKTGEMIERLKRLASRYQAQDFDRVGGFIGRPKNRNEGIFYTVDSLHYAIRNERRVHFSYYRHVIRNGVITSQKSHEFIVSPYALIWNDGKYYLVANYDKYNNFSHYRVDRIRHVDVLPVATRPLSEFSGFEKGFDEEEYIRGVFEMYSGIHEDFVYLNCSMSSIEHVVDRFGQDVICESYDDECFTLRVKANINDGLVSWILAQRGGVKPLYPAELVERGRETIETMRAQYEDGWQRGAF